MTRLNEHLGWRGVWRWMTLPLGDLLLFFAGMAVALLYRGASRGLLESAVAFAPLVVVWTAVLYALGFYDVRVIRNFVSLVRNSLASMALCAGLGVTYFYLMEPYTLLAPKRNLLLTVMLSHAFIMAWRRAWLSVITRNLLDQRLVFLGDQSHVREIEREMGEHFRDKGLQMVAWQWPGVDMIVADSRWVDEHWDEAREVFMAAIRHGVPIISLESFYELVFGKVSPVYAANPSWTLKFILPKTSGFYWKVKRLADVAGASALLILTSPLMAAAAVWIAVGDRGPIFYGHVRAGLLGKPFTLWKFRTMTVGSDAEGPFSNRKSRVTRLGAVLRRFRIDELPQLWNVLRGEMSLVGPRPAEWSQEVEVLGKAVPGYHLRHLVYPGITGWAQLNFRGAYNVDDSLEKIHYDLYYVKYLSLELDLSILLKTLKRVCQNDLHVQVTPKPAVKNARFGPDWAGDLRALGQALES